MRIAVARELAPGEARVALIPDLVGKLRAAGYEVAVQAGAGAAAVPGAPSTVRRATATPA